MPEPEVYESPIKVWLSCTREWVPEASVQFEDIHEDIQGRDVLTFRCPECDETHESLRRG